ncbi:MAG: hypothetical protein ACI8RD_000545 [Bacillariaceae sp.]|jgi:hypothetical protein
MMKYNLLSQKQKSIDWKTKNYVRTYKQRCTVYNATARHKNYYI